MCKRNKWLSRAGAGSLRCPDVDRIFRLQRKRRRCGGSDLTPSTDSTGRSHRRRDRATEAPTEAETTTTTAAPLHPTWAMSTPTTMHIRSGREPITAPSAG